MMTYFTASKKAPRAFVCSEDSSSSIQMLTVAVLQMVQVRAEEKLWVGHAGPAMQAFSWRPGFAAMQPFELVTQTG